MKKINVYEVPVFDLLEKVLEAFQEEISQEVREDIVLIFGRAVVMAHGMLKEQAHDESRLSGGLPGELSGTRAGSYIHDGSPGAVPHNGDSSPSPGAGSPGDDATGSGSEGEGAVQGSTKETDSPL
jgi:hypothetical protein